MNEYKCPHCGAMHVDARRVPACQVWRETFAPTTQDQRIRDLEREVERLRGEVAEWEGAAEANERWRRSTAKKWHEMEADRADAEKWRAHCKSGEATCAQCGRAHPENWQCIGQLKGDDRLLAESPIDAHRAKEGV